MNQWNEFWSLEEDPGITISPITALQSLDKLLERDKKRQEDGFPRKIRIGKMIKPTTKGNRVKILPTVTEEKFVHDRISIPQEKGSAGESGGSGEGEEGDKIGEEPAHDSDQGGQEGAGGEGGGEEHEMEASAYELGKILTEQFQLPNIQEKGKKRSLTQYVYTLTDKHSGVGQLLDKKSTLHQIVRTNSVLGRISIPASEFDPSRLLMAPRDRVFRILSREKEYESQALVFFLRDYSGSMWGKSTEVVVQSHTLIYSWLLYQYQKQVETRFILHDTEAKEVPNFYEYYNAKVAGGTKIASGYKFINKIISEENLARDYNIYVFYGTDGDDWDKKGEETLPAMQETLKQVNRIGITLVAPEQRRTTLEEYLEEMLKNQKNLRLDKVPEEADENRLIEGIRYLTEEVEA